MATSTATPSALPKNPVFAWIFSSVGKKTIVAITGIALVLFVIGHLLGNLTFFVGPDAINAYAKKLHDLGPLLWVARIGLLAAVGLHIGFTMLLWKENQTARPEKYAVKTRVQSSIFVRTMRFSGLIILAFVIFHIAHFTAQVIDPAYSTWKTPEGTADVFKMLVAGFSNVWVSAFYLVSLFLLTFHLSHGISSLFQTLGLNNSRLRPFYERVGVTVAWALFVGFASIPISVVVFNYGKSAL